MKLKTLTVDFQINGKETEPKGAVFDWAGKYRYALWRRWGPGRALFVIGLNPSTADADIDDPTIRRLLGFAKRDGFEALYMGNVYAFRATDPKKVMAERFPIGYYNPLHLLRMHELAEKTIVAWGIHAKHRDASATLGLLKPSPLYCFGKTKDGDPKHPLYLKANTKIRAFEYA